MESAALRRLGRNEDDRQVFVFGMVRYLRAGNGTESGSEKDRAGATGARAVGGASYAESSIDFCMIAVSICSSETTTHRDMNGVRLFSI